MTKLITKCDYEIALDSDQTRKQIIHRNHLMEVFLANNELLNLLSIYEKLFNNKTEHFHNEYAENPISQLNQPIVTFVEGRHLNDFSPILLKDPGCIEWK